MSVNLPDETQTGAVVEVGTCEWRAMFAESLAAKHRAITRGRRRGRPRHADAPPSLHRLLQDDAIADTVGKWLALFQADTANAWRRAEYERLTKEETDRLLAETERLLKRSLRNRGGGRRRVELDANGNPVGMRPFDYCPSAREMPFNVRTPYRLALCVTSVLAPGECYRSEARVEHTLKAVRKRRREANGQTERSLAK